MMKSLIRTALPACLAFGVALLLGAGCGSSSGESLESISVTIGPKGGQVVSGDGKLRLFIPADALTAEQTISVTEQTAADLESVFRTDFNVERVYKLEPDGLTFETPVTVSLTLIGKDREAVTSNSLEIPQRFLLTQTGNRYSIPQDQRYSFDADTDKVVLIGEITHFSRIWDNYLPNRGVTIKYNGATRAAPVARRSFDVTVSVNHPAESLIQAGEAILSDSSLLPVQPPVPLRDDQTIVLGDLNAGRETTLTSSGTYGCLDDETGFYSATVEFTELDLGRTLGLFALAVRPNEPTTIDATYTVSRSVGCGAIERQSN